MCNGDSSGIPSGARKLESQRRKVDSYYGELLRPLARREPDLNLHFGYWRPGLSLLRFAPMLDELTRKVWSRLALSAEREATVVDLGSGLGRPARLMAAGSPKVRVVGVDRVRSQVIAAQSLCARSAEEKRVRFLCADFAATPLASGCADGVVILDAASHAADQGTGGLLSEAARLLRPGGRLSAAEPLRKNDGGSRMLRKIERHVCRQLAIEELREKESFREALVARGFDEIFFEEITWRLAPSAIHWVAWALRLAAFTAKSARVGAAAGHAPLQRVARYLGAVGLAPLLGLARHRYGYYLISATRSDSE